MRLFHIDMYLKPIISSYVSFGTRDVVWECRCGKRKLIREYRNFGDPFSMGWTCNLSKDEMTQVLEKRESQELLIILKISKMAYHSVV